ncbi:MAG TPA: DoxX family protein [Pilimelia sp.]|nr:DoxX family protein [Pilimelia sp.]
MTTPVLPHLALAGFRVVVGFLFLCHGAGKLFGAFGGMPGGGAAPVGAWPAWWAGLIELVCGALVLLGLLTRPAALLASGAMAYAYFVVHQPQALLPIENRGEPAALYCWAFLLLAALGPGRYAVDTLLFGRRGDALAEAVAAGAAHTRAATESADAADRGTRPGPSAGGDPAGRTRTAGAPAADAAEGDQPRPGGAADR